MWKNKGFLSETEYGKIINDPCCRSLEELWALDALYVSSIPYLTKDERDAIFGDIFKDVNKRLGSYQVSELDNNLNSDDSSDFSDESYHQSGNEKIPVEIDIICDNPQISIRVV